MPNKTKILIADTFHKILRQKSIDKITIKDVVDACDISRQTFYYHFQDIMAVIEWTAEQAIELAVERSLAAESPEAAVKAFISMAVEDQQMFHALLKSQQREQLEALLVKGVRSYLQKMISHKGPPAPVNLYDPEIVLDFYACGIVGILLNYSKKKTIDVDRLSKQLGQLLMAFQTDDG